MRARAAIVVVSFLGMGRLVYAATVPAHADHKPVKPVAAAAPKTGDLYAKSVAPVLKKYCIACHSGPGANAGVSVDLYKDDASMLKARSIFDRIAANIRTQHMPPKGSPPIPPADR